MTDKDTPTPRTDRETYTVSAADIGFKVTPVSCAKALEIELNVRKGDPVTRLHNICEALGESKDDSPYSAESWELQDQMYKNKCAELAAERTARRIAELKNQGSLANNLCPDHRDKQTGQPCLACTIERERKARKAAERWNNLLIDGAEDAESRLAEVERATIERCAKACEKQFTRGFTSYFDAAIQCANAIRALSPSPPQEAKRASLGEETDSEGWSKDPNHWANKEPAARDEALRLEGLLALVEDFPELNPLNCDEDDVRKLNDWGILVWQAADKYLSEIARRTPK